LLCLVQKELFMTTINKNNILGVILAGGLSKRMGKINKSLAKINDKTLLEISYNLVRKQLNHVIINSNINLKKKININFEVIPDKIPGYLGPLSGILSAMHWAKNNLPDCKWIASFPVDSVFFPNNFVEIMVDKINNKTQIVCAKSNGRVHPVFALWSIELIYDLEKALVEDGLRKIDKWTKDYNLEIITFKKSSIDPFFNINTKEDLDLAKNYLRN